jgi:ferrochelatase
VIARWWNIPAVKVIEPFYQQAFFIDSLRYSVEQSSKKWEHLLFSFHGLPERQILKSEGKNAMACPEQSCLPSADATFCYRAQCFTTADKLAESLKLARSQYSVSFQSRLGRSPWIKPYTDLYLQELRKKGIKKLAVICPSFTSDCLETLEEVAIRTKESWLSIGGESLEYIPCLNADAAWISSCASIVVGL